METLEANSNHKTTGEEYRIPYPVQKYQRIADAKSFNGLRWRLFFDLMLKAE